MCISITGAQASFVHVQDIVKDAGPTFRDRVAAAIPFELIDNYEMAMMSVLCSDSRFLG